MKAFKFFLLAICLSLPFSDAFAEIGNNNNNLDIIRRPIIVKRNEVKLETSVQKLGDRSYQVTFGKSYEEVSIEVYDEEGYLLGMVEADYVNVGDTIVVNTREDGAVELIVYSNDDEVFYTEL